MRAAALLLAGFTAGFIPAAHAACPIELSTFRDTKDRASVEFRPTPEGAAITNTFRMLLEKDVVLDGIVMWSQGEERPFGLVTYRCPEGEVTRAEIEACTVWEGVIYAADEAGVVSLMPGEGQPAPRTLVFAGLGHGVRNAPAYEAAGLTVTPWDVFQMNGCQE